MINIPSYTFEQLGKSSSLATIVEWDNTYLYNFEEIHSHNFIDILIFEKGGGEHVIDFEPYMIESCSIHIVSNLSTHLAKRSSFSKGFSLLVSQLYVQQLQEFDSRLNYFDFFNQSRIINYTEENFKDLGFYIQEMKKNVQNASVFLNIVASFLSKLATFPMENVVFANQKSLLVKSYLDYINTQYLDKNCISDFSQINFITEVVLRRKLVKEIGKTPKQILNERIILEAKKSLYKNQNSIKEIAFNLGFESEAYFSRFFKKYTQISPRAFRKLIDKESKKVN